MAKDCILNVPPKEPKKNIDSHKHEPQRMWIIKKDKFNTKECVYLYKHKKIKLGGMLTMVVQSI
jgi:hypothetical protein